MPRHKIHVEPVRVALPDAALATTRLRTVGYRAVCSCGESSSVTRELAELRRWRREHSPPSTRVPPAP